MLTKNFKDYLDGNGLLNSDKNKKFEENCILCKKCIDLCPTGNFEIKDNMLVTNNSCIACYRCINHCPVNALHSSKKSLVKHPYKGPIKGFNIKDVMEDYIAETSSPF